MAVKRPSLFLTLGYVLLAILTVLAVVAAERQPNFDLKPDSRFNHGIFVADPATGKRMTLLAIGDGKAAPIRYDSANYDLIHRVTGQLRRDAIERNDEVVRVIRGAGMAQIWFRTSTGVSIQYRPVGRSPLSIQFWLLIFTGLFGGVVGLWVAVLRPDNPAALALGASGLGLLLAAYPVAIILNCELFLAGSTWLNLMRVNYVGIQVFAGSILFAFAIYPQRLMPLPAALAIMLALLAGMITIAAVRYDLATRFADHSRIVLVDLIGIVAFAIWQWHRSVRDPVGRAYLRLVGATAVLVLGGWVATTIGPQFYGGEPLLDIASGALLIVLIYGAIAIGVVRGQMFDVDRWAWRLLASAVTLFAIFMVEAGLVVVYGLDKGPAASTAFLAVGCGWLVARHQLFDRVLGTYRADGSALLGEAHWIVLASSDEERFARWRAALQEAFQPLEMSVTNDGDVSDTSLAEAGLVLLVPAPLFGRPLMLRSAQRGQALFRQTDCVLIDRFDALCTRVDQDRRAYDRGMVEERQRIAKDLHDDVSGRLLTGLHRDDVQLVRADVRSALADLRSIVSGLEGRCLPIVDVLADIHAECDERLAAVGITLEWHGPTDDEPADGSVEYVTYRALYSIMRELSTNVIRHSHAANFVVRLQMDGARGILTIDAHDDGCGLRGEVYGSGLRNIAARASLLGGSVRIWSENGLRVSLVVKLGSPRFGGSHLAVDAA